MKSFLLVVALLSVSTPLRAQQAPAPPPLSSRVPAAKPDDVKSVDSILHALYDVISGPAGDRDWNRFRSLFVPEARLTSAAKGQGGSSIQLFNDGSRWWIISILWDEETPANPLPPELASAK